jgi:hypothetical protein
MTIERLEFDGERTRAGRVDVEVSRWHYETTIEIRTANYPECEQRATMTIEQFREFVSACQEMLTMIETRAPRSHEEE